MNWTPGVVPYGADETVYLVVDSFGARGSVYHRARIGDAGSAQEKPRHSEMPGFDSWIAQSDTSAVSNDPRLFIS